MFLKLSLFVALTFIFSPANAQREIVVMSYESRLPVRDVYIKIDTCQALLRTDYRGRAVLPDSFKVKQEL